MTRLAVERWQMPAADLGSENPLLPLISGRDPHDIGEAPGVPKEMLRNMAYGHVPSILPYTLQDGYDRNRQDRAFSVAVLENEVLRAAFLLEYGGRLWSLVHKPSGRELLFRNPIFQPANLAIRNAWFSGGVEWNIGTIGHSPFTCAPLFAARVVGPEGTPLLRMYEWERIRRVSFQIDAYLPDGSPVLYVCIRIQNPHPHEVPMYWWSNIAVPETVDTRVIVPADSAYSFGYGPHGLRRVAVPVVEGTDVTYTTRIRRAADFFFHIPDGQQPWIATLDREGKGLFQTSTARLKGRKLFLWGTGAGGKRWQRFLSGPGATYLEIQAGLARTQMEHLPMPADSEWSWLEAYGLVEADPAVVHGNNWERARQAVDVQVKACVSDEQLTQEYARWASFVDRPPVELLQLGSGWGALEQMRREVAGQSPFCTAGLLFDRSSLGEAQQPWMELLETGAMHPGTSTSHVQNCMISAEWRELLERSVTTAEGGNWLSWLHLGVMRFAAGEYSAAREAWRSSQDEYRTPWALRNLAVLAEQEGDTDQTAELYAAALRLRPDLLPLAVECGRALVRAGQSAEWLTLAEELSKAVRSSGRVRLLEGEAALQTGDLARVNALFAEKLVIDDLREGERSLSHLWFAYHEQRLSVDEGVPVDEALRERVRREYPVPAEIDFRMS